MPTSPAPSRTTRRTRARGTPPSELLTTPEACAYLRIGKTTLFQYVADGLLHPKRLGPKMLRWDPAELDTLLR
jgi:excisionase family DNA binding protein